MTRQHPVRALVIGSEGNIGTRLVAHLRSLEYEVYEADIRPGWRPNYFNADINHPLDLLPAFDTRPDVVFLLAAAVGRIVCEDAPSLAITTNLAGIENVLQLCRRTGSMCVYFSTSEVYGNHCNPMDDVSSTPCPNNRYGLSKWLAEQLVEYEVRNGGLRAVSLRPCMIYDEEEDMGDHRSAMVRFAANLARGRPIEVHAGSARGWLHVLDAVRAIEAASRVTEYTAINIGNPEVVPMLDLAEMMRRELDADPTLIHVVELPARMTLIKRPSLHRQRTLLGIEPEISLAEGVRRVCQVQSVLARAEAQRAAPRHAPISPAPDLALADNA
jgi:nucleoside-diphosphate-sugar epimerase